MSTAPARSPDSTERSRWYEALCARDARFDGRLFVGVRTTGVYCRPVCRVRTPLARNCLFFGHAAQAEAAGFRPCLRCRPELAPGLSLIDSSHALAEQAARMLDQAVAEGDGLRMPALAARLGVTDRHLRRIFADRFGVAPLDYLATRRLLQAKQLLTDTTLPVTEIAHATGFGSLRRFNAAFAERYRLNPSALRRLGTAAGEARPADGVTVRLGYRPPLDREGLLRFFRLRALPGQEQVTDGTLQRTLAVTHQGRRVGGWISLAFDDQRPELRLRLSPSLVPHLAAVVQRCRAALDLDADPEAIDAVLRRLPCASTPGLRLPGSFDGFETAVRCILGQQVTVAAARTVTRRLLEAFGEPLADAPAGLVRLFPTPQALASASADSLGRLGIVRQRIAALQALSRAVADGHIDLRPAAPLEPTLQALAGLRGIGDWTAQLIAMRVLGWPDAFPATDIGVLNALATRDLPQVRALAETWRPWRAYAVIALWQHLEKPHDPDPARLAVGGTCADPHATR